MRWNPCGGAVEALPVSDQTTMNRTRWSALLDGLLYATLTILVWGVNALQRGMWQDDVQALGEAFRRFSRFHHLRAIVAPGASPLRLLTLVPSAIALATPYPIWALHILSAAIWLAHGLLAGWIAGLLLPGRRWTRFVIVCLTLTATSDFTTGSPVALAYNFAALLLLASAGCALLWLNDGGIVSLVGSPILLACSLLTMDVALPAIPFLALLFLWREGWRPTRRVIALLAGWTIVLIPVAIVEWSFLRDPLSYAATALVPMSKRTLLARTVALWLENFSPWRWPFARQAWSLRPPALISAGWMAAGALIAAVLFLIRARTKTDGAAADGTNNLRLAALFATMAFAANAVYAAVWFSEIGYRSQILSRVWASLAIGIAAGWLVERWPRSRALSWAAVTAFVFLGTWGGIERQDFYLASWRLHQRELASILTAAPALRAGTVLVLRGSPQPGRYLATGAGYLTGHWLRLLYDNPNLQTLRLDPQRGSGCQPAGGGLDCWPEITYGSKKRHFHLRFEDLVLMDYDAEDGTYHLLRSLNGDPLAYGEDADAQRYRPEQRIVVQPWTLRQRRLLLIE
jgi:hypothetical protein